MKFKKILFLSIILFAFFSIVWGYQNSTYRHYKGNDLLFMMNNTAFGYSSMMAYSVYYVFPFLLSLRMFVKKEDAAYITRKKYRSEIFIEKIREIVLFSFLFGFLHMFVNCLWTFCIVTASYSKGQFILFSILNMLGISLFYVSIGIVFLSIGIKFFQNTALFITAIFIGTWYFLDKTVFNPVWTPLKDLVILAQFLDNKLDFSGLMSIYFRQLCIVGILYIIASFLFKRKEFI
ncbi:UNVERIFIED_ORG: hypothetical protein ABRZ91_003024 [Heyndrickxia coagulans]